MNDLICSDHVCLFLVQISGHKHLFAAMVFFVVVVVAMKAIHTVKDSVKRSQSPPSFSRIMGWICYPASLHITIFLNDVGDF